MLPLAVVDLDLQMCRVTGDLSGMCSIRLFAVVRYESVFYDHDPYFNHRATIHLVKEGFFDFINWIDSRTWYPIGRIVGNTVFPGLMSSAAIVHGILNFMGFPMSIRSTCSLLAPMFSGATACSTFLLASEVCKAKWTEHFIFNVLRDLDSRLLTLELDCLLLHSWVWLRPMHLEVWEVRIFATWRPIDTR
jgi:hypothetical protein